MPVASGRSFFDLKTRRVASATPLARSLPQGRYQRIWNVVRRIPPGRVATYGQVAALAQLPGHARLVGYALHALPEHSTVPWHRVINTAGKLSLGRGVPGGDLRQRFLLEGEGVAFDAQGKVSLQRFGWRQPRVATGHPGRRATQRDRPPQ